MFSQSNEEQVILNYFKDKKGWFLDIGAYDGITYSNTHALALNGWRGICIEPTSNAFRKLRKLYKGYYKIFCYNFAIASNNGVASIYENNDGLATLKKDELERWKSAPECKFKLTTCFTKTFDKFYLENKHKYKFINIDAEGMDYYILSQMDLKELGCEMLCIEWNLKQGLKEKYTDYVQQFNMKLIHTTPENLIFSI